MPDSPSVRWVKQSRNEIVLLGTAVPLICLLGILLVPSVWVLFAVSGGLVLLLSIQTYAQHTRVLHQLQRRNL